MCPLKTLQVPGQRLKEVSLEASRSINTRFPFLLARKPHPSMITTIHSESDKKIALILLRRMNKMGPSIIIDDDPDDQELLSVASGAAYEKK